MKKLELKQMINESVRNAMYANGHLNEADGITYYENYKKTAYLNTVITMIKQKLDYFKKSIENGHEISPEEIEEVKRDVCLIEDRIDDARHSLF